MRYVKEFDGLRGILALWVLFGHLASSLPFANKLMANALYNQQAVTVFIILSGFAIAAMIDKKSDTYIKYIQRRILRIFPAYLFFLFISIALAPLALAVWTAAPEASMKAARIQIAADSIEWRPRHVIAHLVALQGVIPPSWLPSTDYAFLGQAWSISLEWQFYLIAPAMIAILLGRSPNSSIQKNGVILALSVLAYISIHAPAGFIGKWLPDFSIGILGYHGLKQVASNETVPARWIDTAVFVVTALTVVSLRSGSLPYLVWSIAFGAILSRSKADGNGNLVSRMLLISPLQWVGRMAYSVYLSHMIVLVAGLWIVERLSMTHSWTIAGFLLVWTVVGSLAVSWLSFTFVEMPFHRWGRSL